MIGSLESFIKEYNEKMGSTCMAMDLTDDNKLVMAICTPLMQRVHTHLQHAGEMVFMDSSSNMDRHCCSVFLLLTHSCVGGLPIGVLITTSESEATLKAALNLYQSILPPNCFAGRGRQGPQIFMTDDCVAEQKALRHTFPQSVLLLCVFHVLQATWRWIWDAKNNIPKDKRPHHLHHMKRLVYAETAEDIDRLYEDSLQDTSIIQ